MKSAFWGGFEKRAMDEDKRNALSLASGLAGYGVGKEVADGLVKSLIPRVDAMKNGRYLSYAIQAAEGLLPLVAAYGGARAVQKLVDGPDGFKLRSV